MTDQCGTFLVASVEDERPDGRQLPTRNALIDSLSRCFGACDGAEINIQRIVLVPIGGSAQCRLKFRCRFGLPDRIYSGVVECEIWRLEDMSNDCGAEAAVGAGDQNSTFGRHGVERRELCLDPDVDGRMLWADKKSRDAMSPHLWPFELGREGWQSANAFIRHAWPRFSESTWRKVRRAASKRR